ncbi:ESX-1-secreted protein regulator, EspR [Mycobacteroides abscessus subsp. abscessus]|nr:ESX-1-secreted protein regulator, EspR [Mycobacteroides abscessus subsp. abscessus]
MDGTHSEFTAGHANAVRGVGIGTGHGGLLRRAAPPSPQIAAGWGYGMSGRPPTEKNGCMRGSYEGDLTVGRSTVTVARARAGGSWAISVVALRAIADYFGVPASYLIESGTDARIKAQLEQLRLLRDEGVRDIALRAAGLSPQALVNVAAIIDRARALEQLPSVEPSDATSSVQEP